MSERQQKSDETAQDDFDSAASDCEATDDDVTPEPPAARRAFFPSSIGLSLLVSRATRRLRVEASWGDYRAEPLEGLFVRRTDFDSPADPGRTSVGLAVLERIHAGSIEPDRLFFERR